MIYHLYDPVSFRYIGPSNTFHEFSSTEDPNDIDWSDLPDSFVIFYDKEYQCWDKTKSYEGQVYFHKVSKDRFKCPTVFWPTDRLLSDYTRLEPPSKGYSYFNETKWIMEYDKISHAAKKIIISKINKHLSNTLSTIDPISIMYRSLYAENYLKNIPIPDMLQGAIIGENIELQCIESIRLSKSLSNIIGQFNNLIYEFNTDLSQLVQNNSYETLAFQLVDSYNNKIGELLSENNLML